MCGSCMGIRGGVILGGSGGRVLRPCSKRMAGPFFIVVVLVIACTGTKDEVSLTGALSLSPATLPVPVSSPPAPLSLSPCCVSLRKIAACLTPYPDPTLLYPPLLLCPVFPAPPSPTFPLVHLCLQNIFGSSCARRSWSTTLMRCTLHDTL
jgi:hypothetical protein